MIIETARPKTSEAETPIMDLQVRLYWGKGGSRSIEVVNIVTMLVLDHGLACLYRLWLIPIALAVGPGCLVNYVIYSGFWVGLWSCLFETGSLSAKAIVGCWSLVC